MQLNKNIKIFLAGHNGMVGSSILNILKKKKYKNIITQSRKKLDLTDQKKTQKFIKKKQKLCSQIFVKQASHTDIKV